MAVEPERQKGDKMKKCNVLKSKMFFLESWKLLLKIYKERFKMTFV
jgi:hypothetical protein